MNTDFLIIGGGCGGLETAIHLRKLVAHARGQELRNFDVEKTRKAAGMAIPDCGGQTVMVRNGRVLASGRWPLLLRAMVDRRYLKARR